MGYASVLYMNIALIILIEFLQKLARPNLKIHAF